MHEKRPNYSCCVLTAGIHHPTEKPHMILRFLVLNLLRTLHHLYIRISSDFPAFREHLTWKQSASQSKCPREEAQLLLFNLLPPPTVIFSAKCWENSRLKHLRLSFFQSFRFCRIGPLSKNSHAGDKQWKKILHMKIIWRESLTLMNQQSFTRITLWLNATSQFFNKTGSI